MKCHPHNFNLRKYKSLELKGGTPDWSPQSKSGAKAYCSSESSTADFLPLLSIIGDRLEVAATAGPSDVVELLEPILVVRVIRSCAITTTDWSASGPRVSRSVTTAARTGFVYTQTNT